MPPVPGCKPSGRLAEKTTLRQEVLLVSTRAILYTLLPAVAICRRFGRITAVPVPLSAFGECAASRRSGRFGGCVSAAAGIGVELGRYPG